MDFRPLGKSQAIPHSCRYFSEARPQYEENKLDGNYAKKDGAKAGHYVSERSPLFFPHAGMRIIWGFDWCVQM
jgi:hypothetical protein